MGCRCRVDRERLGIADVCEMADEFEALDEFPAAFFATCEAKRQHRTETVPKVLLRAFVERMIFKTRIADPGYAFLLFEPLRQFERVEIGRAQSELQSRGHLVCRL